MDDLTEYYVTQVSADRCILEENFFVQVCTVIFVCAHEQITSVTLRK